MADQILIDDNSPLLLREGMSLKSFSSDFRLVRFATMMITQHAPSCLKEIHLMEQQICELIKNGCKHGNNYNKDKKIHVWYQFTTSEARLIVEDEGEGFQELEKWNHFKLLRDRAFRSRDFQSMAKYALWKGKNSREEDGGNALFAALEYWNEGIVYSSKRNCVGVKRTFPKVVCPLRIVS